MLEIVQSSTFYNKNPHTVLWRQKIDSHYIYFRHRIILEKRANDASVHLRINHKSYNFLVSNIIQE